MTGICIMGAMREDRAPVKWNKKFIYPTSTRSLIQGKRHYDISPTGSNLNTTQTKLPSVTTIISATQSEEKRQALANWKARLGDQAADRVRDVAAMRGTAMHTFLDAYVRGTGHRDLTSIGKEAEPMAKIIINQGLTGLNEIWGSEVVLYYPDLYAGATDVVGIYNGRESIIDFKQTNKPKRREWIEDYFIQLGAYAMAHNFIYDTKIQSGIILMCSKDKLFQKFEASDKEFVGYQHAFLRKVDQYYRDQKDQRDHKDTKNEQVSQ
jgi:genome maintenance exonuclease 1